MAGYLTPVGEKPIWQVQFEARPGSGSRSFGGSRKSGVHAGVDVPSPIGTPIRAPGDGTIVGNWVSSSGYGNIVDIELEDGTVHRFAHVNGPGPIAVGTKVPQGTVIANVGVTGNADPDFQHAHYEVINNDRYYGGGEVYASYDKSGRGVGPVIGHRLGGRDTIGRQDPRLYAMGYRGPNALVEFQTAAKAAGLYTGEIDGKTGPLTRLAIANGGQLARDATTAVASAAPPLSQAEKDWRSASGYPSGIDAAKTTEIQTDLAERGFYDGPIDGKWTPAVETAINTFAVSPERQEMDAAAAAETAATPATATPATAAAATDPEVQALAGVLYAEARGEGVEGMQGVANVVMNRVAETGNRFPATISGVVGPDANGKREFAAPLTPKDPNDPQYQQALDLATRAKAGELEDITGGAQFFYNGATSDPKRVAAITTDAPYETAKIGNHIYRSPTEAAATAPPTALASLTDPDIVPEQPVPELAFTPPPVEDVNVPGTVQPASITGDAAAAILRQPKSTDYSPVTPLAPFAPITEAAAARPMPEYPLRAGDTILDKEGNPIWNIGSITNTTTGKSGLVQQRTDGSHIELLNRPWLEGGLERGQLQLERAAPMPQGREGDAYAEAYGDQSVKPFAPITAPPPAPGTESYTPFTRLSPEQVAGYDAWRATPEPPPAARPMPAYPPRAGDTMVFNRPGETVRVPITDPHDITVGMNGVEGQLERQAPMPQGREGDVHAGTYGSGAVGAWMTKRATPPAPPPTTASQAPMKYLPGKAELDAPYPYTAAPGFEQLKAPAQPELVGPHIVAPQPVEDIAAVEPAASVASPLPEPGAITVGVGKTVAPGITRAPPGTAASVLPEETYKDQYGVGGFTYTNPWSTSPDERLSTEPSALSTEDAGPLVVPDDTPTFNAPADVTAATPAVAAPPVTNVTEAREGGGGIFGKGLFSRLASSFGGEPKFTGGGATGTTPNGWAYERGTGFQGQPGTQFTSGGRTYTYTDTTAFGGAGIGGWS